MKKVSVYVVNYNYGHYLEKAIESVLNQTYPNLEILVFDDGSTDNSKTILQEYERNDRIQIFYNQNQGLNATIIAAFKQATGEFVIRLDADDWFKRDIIEKLVNEIEKSENTALVFPDYYEVNESGQILHQIKRHNFNSTVTLLDQPAHGACTLIRKLHYESVGGLSDAYSCQDGVDLWLSVTHKFSVANVNEPLFYYRKHSSSLSSNQLRILQTRSRIYKDHAYQRGVQPNGSIALIPVRSRDVGNSDFALLKVANRTLLDWTINKAEKSDEIEEIVILTESDKIINYISEHQNNYTKHIKAVRRDSKYAGAGVDLAGTLINYLEGQTKKVHNNIVVLTIDTPFSQVNYIDTAIYSLYLYDTESVDSVLNNNSIFYFHDGHGLKLWQDIKLRQERDDIYIRKGGITVIKRDALFAHKSLLTKRMGHILIDKLSAFEIESLEDLNIANVIGAKLIGEEDASE